MQQKLTDNELIELVLKGNRSAFSDLIKRHQRHVFNLAIKIVKSREDAEEVAQDSFVKAFKALPEFQRTAKFSTWMYRIVYNTAIGYLRKKRVDVISTDDESNYIQIENQVSDYSAEKYENTSKVVLINQAISELSMDDSTVISLFYHNEQSLEEIAVVMNLEVNNVKVKLHRARLRLKQKLETMLKHEVHDLI